MGFPRGTRLRGAITPLLLLAACAAPGSREASESRPLQADSGSVLPVGSDEQVSRETSAAPPAPSLLLWGGVDAADAPFLDPVFVIDAPAALPRSRGEYVVEGRAADGAVLFSLPFEMPVIADGDGSSSFVFVLPAQPGWEGSLASVTLTGPGGSATLDGESRRPMAILRDPATGRIRGILRDLPPTVTTQAAADTAVARAPGLEVLFSRGIPGPEAWRR